ncbi:MAG: hypothetical protein IJR93_14845 [Treponema sp.]|nr:hypothetical protein [Treponema sp.]
MYAAVRDTSTTRNGLLAWLTSAACLLCLTACPGNGGAQDSGGTVYTGSGGGSSGSSISADDIRTWSNSDEFGKLIELLSGGSSGGSGGGSAGTTPVDLSTDDWGIPAGGGTVTITMTVTARPPHTAPTYRTARSTSTSRTCRPVPGSPSRWTCGTAAARSS